MGWGKIRTGQPFVHRDKAWLPEECSTALLPHPRSQIINLSMGNPLIMDRAFLIQSLP